MVLVWGYLQENVFLNCGYTIEETLSPHLLTTDFLQEGVGTWEPFYPSHGCLPIRLLGMGSRQPVDRHSLVKKVFCW